MAMKKEKSGITRPPGILGCLAMAVWTSVWKMVLNESGLLLEIF